MQDNGSTLFSGVNLFTQSDGSFDFAKAALAAWVLILGLGILCGLPKFLREGRVFFCYNSRSGGFRSTWVVRDKNPILFWVLISTYIAFAASFIFLAIMFSLGWPFVPAPVD